MRDSDEQPQQSANHPASAMTDAEGCVVELIETTLAAEATPVEVTELHRHLGTGEASERLARISEILSTEGNRGEVIHDDTADRLTALHARLGIVDDISTLSTSSRAHLPVQGRRGIPRHSNTTTRGSIIARAFAAAAVLAIVGIVIRTNVTPQHAAPATYTTTAGRMAIVPLVNGVQVALAPRTVLVARGTDLTISGEANIDVTHHIATPVVVHVGGATVRVLGTTFSVRHYATDRDVQVAVREGRVALSAPTAHAPVTVVAGQLATLHDSTVDTEPLEHLSSYTDWATHQLVFQGAPVSDILTVLGRWYGYRFQLADSTLAGRHLSAAFDARSINGTLALLKATLDVTLTFDDTVVTLAPRRREVRRPRDMRYQLQDSFSTSHEVGR